MAFGRRTREEKIGRLLGEDAQYVPLAAEIGKRVAAEVRRTDDRQVSEAYREALETTEQQERRRQMADIFDRLPAEKRFSILQQYFDDEGLREAISKHRENILKRDVQNNAVRELQSQGAREHRVDLSRIPAEMTLYAELYYIGLRRRRDRYDFHPLHGRLARSMQFSSLGDSQFMVIKDEIGQWGRSVREPAQPKLKQYQTIQLGRGVGLEEGDELGNYAYYAQPLALIDEGAVLDFRHDHLKDIDRPPDKVVLGGLSLNNTRLLGDFLE